MRNHIKHIGLLITLLIFCGCTEKESSSSVVIEFQSKGVSSQSLAAEDIEIIIVNVSGPGIPTKVVAQRDCHESNEVCSSIVLNDIPTGSNRFIQLLVVTKESETDNGSIYYGDVESEIVGEVSVPILIEEKANFNNEADFVGQYKPKIGHPLANKFLTGNMSVNVFVGLGKPLMTIGSTEIFGGWFNFFLLDTVRFKMFFTGWDETGAFHSNIEIFNDLHNGLGLNIDKIMVDASSSNTKIASFNYEGDIWEERDNEFLKRNFEQKIFAILGPSVKEACYDSGSAYDGSSGSRICTDEDCDSYLQWSSVERSLAGDSVACPALAAKKWKLDVSRLEDEDDLAGFYGPFSSQGDGNPYIYIDGSSVMWRLDDKSKISGVHVFTRTTAGFDEDSIRTHGIGDGYDCSKLSANGFSQPKSGSLSSGIYTYSLNSSEQTAYTNGNLMIH